MWTMTKPKPEHELDVLGALGTILGLAPAISEMNVMRERLRDRAVTQQDTAPAVEPVKLLCGARLCV